MSKTFSIAVIGAMVGAAVTLGVVGLTGCGGGPQVLAVVNGETITMDDFHKYLETKRQVRVTTNNGVVELPVADTLAFQGLQDMIANKLLTQYAKDNSMTPTEPEIANELDFRKKLRPNYVIELTSLGQTLEGIKSNIALDVAKEKLVTKGITVSKADADNFKKENASEFITPASADLTGILVATEAEKAKAEADLNAGETFKSVASKYSKFPNGGTLGEIPLNRFSGPLLAAIQKAQPQTTTPWVKITEGWARFYVNKKSAAKPMALDDAQMELLRRRIAIQRGASAIDLDARLAEKLEKSNIEVKQKSLETAWKQAIERFTKERKVKVGTSEPGDPTSGKAPEGQ